MEMMSEEAIQCIHPKMLRGGDLASLIQIFEGYLTNHERDESVPEYVITRIFLNRLTDQEWSVAEVERFMRRYLIVMVIEYLRRRKYLEYCEKNSVFDLLKGPYGILLTIN